MLGCLLAYYVLETEHGLISYKLLLVTLPIVNCQLLIVHCLVDLCGYFLDAVCSSYRVEVEAWDAMGYQLFALLHAPCDTHFLSFRIGVALQNLLGQFLGQIYFERLGYHAESVSYTHLDVYKRQVRES